MPLPTNRRFLTTAILTVFASLVAGGCGSKPAAAPAVQGPAFLAQKAKESGGDFSKLSPADQKEVQMLTQGHGPQALRSWARHLAHP